jgi:hypothetical protein
MAATLHLNLMDIYIRISSRGSAGPSTNLQFTHTSLCSGEHACLVLRSTKVFYDIRSENMQLSLRCPDAWVYDGVPTSDSDSASQVLDIEVPVFGANDLVGGTILLSSELTKQGKGKLSISVRVRSIYLFI